MWRALDCPFPVASVIQGTQRRLLGVVWSPEVGGSWRALGRPCVGRSEPAKTEATAAVRVWRDVGALLGSRLSRAPICGSQIPELSKVWSFFVQRSDRNGPLWLEVGQGQGEVGKLGGSGLTWMLLRGTEASFISSVMCLEAGRGWGRISMCFPGMFLDAKVPSPPHTAASSLLSWDHCWWCGHSLSNKLSS